MSDSNNLSISVSADTSKARADIKLLNAEISKTSAALRDAVKAGDPAAQSAQYQTLQGQYQQLARAQATVTAAKKQDTAATREATQAHKGYSASLREGAIELGHLAHAAGLPVEGLKALRSGFTAFAAVEVIRGFTAAIKEINDLNIAAKEALTTVGTLKGLQSAFRAAGDDAAKAAPLLSTFNKAMREERLRPVEADRAAARAAAGVIAAGGDQAAAEEAAAKARLDAALATTKQGEALKFLNINLDNYKNNEEGRKKLELDTAAALLKKGNTDQAAATSLTLYGQELAVITPELEKIAKGGYEFPEPSKENLALMQEYNALAGAIGDAWAKTTEQIGLAGAAMAIAATKTETWRAAIAGTGAIAGIGGFASGGYIRGAGSGTSDSILARLSNGEFVVNAASTRRLGTGLLNRLNSFAAGGLVNVPPIRFAEGGLVPSFAGGGQAMAAFHFESGSSFRLGGPVDVVNAMVNEAHAQQVRSAGVKPSWYAARPSGR